MWPERADRRDIRHARGHCRSGRHPRRAGGARHAGRGEKIPSVRGQVAEIRVHRSGGVNVASIVNRRKARQVIEARGARTGIGMVEVAVLSAVRGRRP